MQGPLVYQKPRYIEIFGVAAEQSMQALPDYSTKGEVHVAIDKYFTVSFIF